MKFIFSAKRIGWILLIAGMALSGLRSFAQSADVITLDFAHPIGPARHIGSGMLLSISQNQPEDKYIVPLHFTSWRMGSGKYGPYRTNASDLYKRVRSFGVEDIYNVLSTLNLPGDQDRSRWLNQRDSEIRKTVSRALERQEQYVWDIWNEPNLKIGAESDSIFSSYEDWFEVWDRAYRAIRSVDPKAQIMGPSYSGLDLEQIQRFIEHCAHAHTMPQVIDWHFGNIADYPAANKSIKEQASRLGYTVTTALGEAIGAGTDRNLDAGLPAYLFGVAEREQMRAVHATWSSIPMAGDKQDSAAELAGLVTRETKVPRGVWWTYKAYGDMTGEMVAVQAQPTVRVDGVACFDSEKKYASILLGTKESIGGAVELHLTGVKGASFLNPETKTAHFQITRIPSTEVDLPAPIRVSEGEVRLNTQDGLDLIAYVGNRESIVIQLTPGTLPIPDSKQQTNADEKRLPFSSSFHNVNTSDTSTVFEGEDMPVESASKVVKIEHRNSSGLAHSLAQFSAKGDSASYSFQVKHAGNYMVWIRYTLDPDGGVVQSAINGRDVFGAIDTYSAKHSLHEISCCVVALDAGSQKISFRVLGKNASSHGYVFGLDAVRITAVIGQKAFRPQDLVSHLADVSSDSGKISVRAAGDHVSALSAGEALQYEIPALPPGKYNVAIDYTTGPNMGSFALLLDGSSVGTVHDSHRQTEGEVTLLDEKSNFDTAIIPPGSHTLSFLAVDKPENHSPKAIKINLIVFTQYKTGKAIQ